MESGIGIVADDPNDPLQYMNINTRENYSKLVSRTIKKYTETSTFIYTGSGYSDIVNFSNQIKKNHFLKKLKIKIIYYLKNMVARLLWTKEESSLQT